MIQALFWLCALALVYTYAGYPLLMRWWARVRPRPVQRAPVQPRVAMIVVAYNEQARIEAKIQTCLAQNYPAERLRVVIASDGSTDATHAIVAAQGDARVRLLPFGSRRGKAACLNDAAAACDEEVLVFTDARQALNPDAVRCLVENLADPRVGAVSGELMFVSDDMTPFAEGIDAYWRYEKFIRQQEALVHSAPGVTGALYAIRRSCFQPIDHRTILDDVAIPMQVIKAGLRVVFDSRAVAYDRPSQQPAQEKVRKVRTLAGNYQLMAMMPWTLNPARNPIFVQFVSHKLLRLLAPLAMLLLLLCNIALAFDSGVYLVMLVVQLSGYAMALAASIWPALGRWRVARLAAAFLALNWYAVLGLKQFLSNRDAHLWQTASSTSGREG